MPQFHFDQAADLLNRALLAEDVAEQAPLLDEALRLNRLALREKGARYGSATRGDRFDQQVTRSASNNAGE